jgi:hypothetical protein
MVATKKIMRVYILLSCIQVVAILGKSYNNKQGERKKVQDIGKENSFTFYLSPFTFHQQRILNSFETFNKNSVINYSNLIESANDPSAE